MARDAFVPKLNKLKPFLKQQTYCEILDKVPVPI